MELVDSMLGQSGSCAWKKRAGKGGNKPHDDSPFIVLTETKFRMFALLFDLEDYVTTYCVTRDAYLKAANELKLATGPYKAARDVYVAATNTYTKSLYE